MTAFEAVRVLDLTHVLAGPFCTYQLALLGADVIKIEAPYSPDCARRRGPVAALNAAGQGINYQVQGANKRALAIDLATPEGNKVFRRLAETADVVVENYRRGALDALGLDAATLVAANPTLIHCSISGFGAVGAWGDLNAYDNVIQAASGMMVQTGGAGPPVKTGASVIDYTTGMAAAFAIAAALHERTRTGRGQIIDVAMLDTALTLMAPEVSAASYTGTQEPLPPEAGLGCYETADGLLMLGAFNPRQNRRLWTLLDRPDFAAIDDWPGLWAAAAEMREALTLTLRGRSAAAWEDLLAAAGVPARRVRTVAEAASLPHLGARDYFHTFETAASTSVTIPLAPFRFAHDGPRIVSPPPAVGEHSDAVLAEAGIPAADIARLRAAAVVA